jgi:hypothetical protein
MQQKSFRDFFVAAFGRKPVNPKLKFAAVCGCRYGHRLLSD